MADAVLTSAQVAEIHKLYAQKVGNKREWPMERLAVHFGCSIGPIRNVLKGYGAYAVKDVPVAEVKLPEWQVEALRQMEGEAK